MITIARTLLSGFLLLLPLVITLALVFWLVTFLEQFIGPDSTIGGILTSIGLSVSASRMVAYLVGLFVLFLVIYILGLIVESRVSPWLYGFVERVMRNIPIVSSIYDLTKKFVALIERKDTEELKGMKPVWCFFGGDESAGVLALLPTSQTVLIGGQHYYAILVPSAPIPFGGGLIYVPSKWIRPASGGVEQLLNVYVSMGVDVPSPPATQASASFTPTHNEQ